MTGRSHLVHLGELVKDARRLRQEAASGDWRAGWLLILLVQEWWRTRQIMLQEPYDPEVTEKVKELECEFVAVLKGSRASQGGNDEAA